jgi:hypothetical protein
MQRRWQHLHQRNQQHNAGSKTQRKRQNPVRRFLADNTQKRANKGRATGK